MSSPPGRASRSAASGFDARPAAAGASARRERSWYRDRAAGSVVRIALGGELSAPRAERSARWALGLHARFAGADVGYRAPLPLPLPLPASARAQPRVELQRNNPDE